MSTKTLTGPDGLRIELDSKEIVPGDPGAGTPAMVYKKTAKGEASGTYWCVNDTGEMICGRTEVTLTEQQAKWVADQEDVVNDFIKENS